MKLWREGHTLKLTFLEKYWSHLSCSLQAILVCYRYALARRLEYYINVQRVQYHIQTYSNTPSCYLINYKKKTIGNWSIYPHNIISRMVYNWIMSRAHRIIYSVPIIYVYSYIIMLFENNNYDILIGCMRWLNLLVCVVNKTHATCNNVYHGFKLYLVTFYTSFFFFYTVYYTL